MFTDLNTEAEAARLARWNSLSQRQQDTETFMREQRAFADAKARGDIQLIWETLDEIAFGALWCETPVIRRRYIGLLSAARSEFRLDGCTKDEFACLDAFWDLPRRA